MAKRKLVIVGDSSFAEIACEMFDAAGLYEVAAFAVHRQFLTRTDLLGRPILCLEDIGEAIPPSECDAFVALTYRELNRARTRICAEVRGKGYKLASYVSPDAFVWRNVTVGENCFVFEQNVLQPFVNISDNVILWSGNHIGHHSSIGENVFIASHVVISGHVTIGKNSFIGVNATVADTVRVAEDNWIGPNSLITKDTEPGAMYRSDSTPPSSVGSLRFFRVKGG
ncbi:MAG: acetyltransferase [Alphaproteobacteria bacterium]|nr:acetyltransferase [Alphaproteobacteria bacterium]